MEKIKIGTLTLKHGLLLAPMAGVTDSSFRAVCRKEGAEYTVSEMVSAKALCFEQKSRPSVPLRTAPLAEIYDTDIPMAVQLFGSEPDFMVEAAALLESGNYRGAKENRPVAIDINMGCPVHKVVGNGEGSALMKDPEKAASIVSAVKKRISLPVTVKIRAGFDEEHKNAPEFAKRLEAAGADLICVHGRTRSQFYAPGSDNKIVAAVKKAVKIPVVGNGDLFTATDVKRILEETGCDGVMIARGALGNPFLFAEITAMAEEKPYTTPDIGTRLTVALAQAADMVAKKGERVGIAEAKKHMAWYCKGLRGAATARGALMGADSLADFELIFKRLQEEEPV